MDTHDTPKIVLEEVLERLFVSPARVIAVFPERYDTYRAQLLNSGFSTLAYIAFQQNDEEYQSLGVEKNHEAIAIARQQVLENNSNSIESKYELFAQYHDEEGMSSVRQVLIDEAMRKGRSFVDESVKIKGLMGIFSKYKDNVGLHDLATRLLAEGSSPGAPYRAYEAFLAAGEHEGQHDARTKILDHSLVPNNRIEGDYEFFKSHGDKEALQRIGKLALENHDPIQSYKAFHAATDAEGMAMARNKILENAEFWQVDIFEKADDREGLRLLAEKLKKFDLRGEDFNIHRILLTLGDQKQLALQRAKLIARPDPAVTLGYLAGLRDDDGLKEFGTVYLTADPELAYIAFCLAEDTEGQHNAVAELAVKTDTDSATLERLLKRQDPTEFRERLRKAWG